MTTFLGPRPIAPRSSEPSRRPIVVTADDRHLRATVIGPFDRQTGAELRRTLEVAGVSDCDGLEVDLRRTDYLDSDGVRSLQSLAEGLARRTAEFHVLVRAGGRPDRTLSLLELERVLHVRREGSAASQDPCGPKPLS